MPCLKAAVSRTQDAMYIHTCRASLKPMKVNRGPGYRVQKQNHGLGWEFGLVELAFIPLLLSCSIFAPSEIMVDDLGDGKRLKCISPQMGRVGRRYQGEFQETICLL